jgi:hypothetical protein
MVDWVTRFSSRCFSQVLLGLHHDTNFEAKPNLFSRGCVDFFHKKDFETYGYQFTQIFEEAVLNEVIVLNGLPGEDVYSIRYGESKGLERLRSLISSANDISVPALANTIAALISISRFRIASTLLSQLRPRATKARETFELGWLEFLLSNRFAEGRDSMAAFDRMRLATKTGAIPAGRILDVCTQGVVWHLKRREVDAATFRWCLAVGTRLARQADQVGFLAISNWFRGVAMLPASCRQAEVAREYMEFAQINAKRSIAEGCSLSALNALKTYYESCIKEHLYVKPDRDLALESAQSLITLDPTWAPSYGECAEIYARFREYDSAADFYEKAATVGPPYFGYHLRRAARCWVKAGEIDRGTAHYSHLIALAPNDVALRVEAMKIASHSPMADAEDLRSLGSGKKSQATAQP